MEQVKKNKKLYLLLQIGAFLMAAVFLKAINWGKNIYLKKILLDICIALCIIISPLFMIANSKFVDSIQRIKQRINTFLAANKKRNIIENKKRKS